MPEITKAAATAIVARRNFIREWFGFFGFTVLWKLEEKNPKKKVLYICFAAKGLLQTKPVCILLQRVCCKYFASRRSRLGWTMHRGVRVWHVHNAKSRFMLPMHFMRGTWSHGAWGLHGKECPR